MNRLLIRIARILPDKQYLSLKYYREFGRFPNWKKPQTFSEKLQWLKLYDRRPEYTTMVDKYAVKEYVTNVIGCEHVIPTLGVWDRPEDIDWDKLPTRFVLKTTHGGGNDGVVICRNINTFDKEYAINKLNKSLRTDLYKVWREWPYKDVPRRIIAEQFIAPTVGVNDLPDYKWYCFNGEPKFCQLIQDRSLDETIDFYDTDWVHQGFIGLHPVAHPIAHPAAHPAARPKNLETHIRIARKLSKDIPFSRIDLYEANNNTYFGEITFYPLSGLGTFTPERYNEILGKMLILPSDKLMVK